MSNVVTGALQNGRNAAADVLDTVPIKRGSGGS
jgi:hypothetical protein